MKYLLNQKSVLKLKGKPSVRVRLKLYKCYSRAIFSNPFPAAVIVFAIQLPLIRRKRPGSSPRMWCGRLSTFLFYQAAVGCVSCTSGSASL